MRKLAPVVLVLVAVKCLLAWRFPLTGDEAYFAFMAKHLSLGYYDHPPMLMWLLHGVLYLGNSTLLLRLPAIVSTTVVGVGIYALLKSYDEDKAYLAFLLFMVSPLNTAVFVITTDMPLLLFSFLSVYLLFRAEQRGPYVYYLLSGVCLGLAFLSKYFAILLGLSYLVYFVSAYKDRRSLKGAVLLFVAAMPFVAQNAIWNYQNGWPNLMHNWINRFRDDTHITLNLLCLAVTLVYFLTPPVVYFLYRHRRAVVRQGQKREFRVLMFAVLVPLFVFLIASFRKTVWPHWLLSFLPFAYILAALPLGTAQIRKSIRVALVLSTVQVGLLLAAGLVPTRSLKGVLEPSDLASLVMHVHPQRVIRTIQEHEDGFILATKSYQLSAVLEHYTGNRVIVFGKGSRHARQDDILTDFSQLDGRDMLILYKGTPGQDSYLPYFEDAETRPLEIEGAEFTLVFGYGFKYAEYLQICLASILEAYYQIPRWLPYSRSFFHEKYNF